MLECLPYRKGDAMARRDSRRHPSFAGDGTPRSGSTWLPLRLDARARRLAYPRRDDSRMTATATEFLVTHALDAYAGEERVYARTWTLRFARDGV